jgi:hypothetical protein
MKKVMMPLAAIALVGLYAGSASAQCAFNLAPAKGVKGSMVRNYAPCPGTEHPITNTASEAGTEACTPVTPYQVGGQGTTYKYGPKGKCDVQTKAILVPECSTATGSNGQILGLEAGPCHITYVKSKCSGIVNDLNVLIDAADVGWKLATLTRVSFDDESNNDMTIIDFPVTFNYSIPKKGKILINSSSAEALIPLVGLNNAELPACTSLEIVDVTIKAPGELPFAKLGGATKPK